MRNLGVENFYYEILEECAVEELRQKEQYYIDLFDSWHNGYNNGNADQFQEGERNPKTKMKEEQIKEIRIRQDKMKENRREIYEDFKELITWTNFLYICKYLTWPQILPELNKPEVMEWHKKQLGNESRKFSEEDLINIINLKYKENMSCAAIARLYDKNRKTIERIFNGTYYKKEMEDLKKNKPYLFTSEGSTTTG